MSVSRPRPKMKQISYRLFISFLPISFNTPPFESNATQLASFSVGIGQRTNIYILKQRDTEKFTITKQFS